MEEKEVKKQTETISIVGFIFSIFIPIVGLILSIIGLSKSKSNNSNKGFAVAGLIISIFGLLIRLLMIAFAVFAFVMVAPKTGEFVTDTMDKMCSKVQWCEEGFGDFYTCHYSRNNFEYTITCPYNKIPDGVIKKDNDIDNLPEDTAYTLEDLEDIALNYYEYKNNEKLKKAVATNLENNKVEIKLYSDDNLNKPIVIYTIDRETLVGSDANGIFVDLTESITDSL